MIKHSWNHIVGGSVYICEVCGMGKFKNLHTHRSYYFIPVKDKQFNSPSTVRPNCIKL